MFQNIAGHGPIMLVYKKKITTKLIVYCWPWTYHFRLDDKLIAIYLMKV